MAGIHCLARCQHEQFIFNDPSKGGSGQAFAQAAIVYVLGDQNKYSGTAEMKLRKVADWGKVWDWFNADENKSTITFFKNDSTDRVNQGVVLVAAAWDDDTAVAFSMSMVQALQTLHPGLWYAGGDSLGMSANAPQKAAAILFIAHII